MTARLTEGLIKALVLLFIAAALLLRSISAEANDDNPVYKGFDVKAVRHCFRIKSNIDVLNDEHITQGGARIGIKYGNQIMRLNLGAGYYSSVGKTRGSVDGYELGALLNYYPLANVNGVASRVEPYVSAGVSHHTNQFRGFYGNENTAINYSQSDAPFVGSVKEINGSLAAGLEYRLLNESDFIHFFSEVRYFSNVSNHGTGLMSSTAVDEHLQICAGVSFGLYR